MIPSAFAVVAGQLLGTAFAAGLNLYATIAILGLASRLHWMPALPPALRGLESTLVIATALILFIVEFVIEKVRYAGAVWDAVHTIVRPLAAAMLAIVALEGVAWDIEVAAAIASAIVAFAAHGAQAGLRVMIANSRFNGRWAITLTTIVIDALAIALAAATLIRPTAALAIVGGAIALSLLIGPRLWRAAVFGAESVARRVHRFFGGQGWQAREGLPRSIRRVVPPPDLGCSPARAARAAAVGVPGAGAYRTGWLVVADGGNAFVFRSFLLRPRRVDLPRFNDSRVESGPLSDSLHFQTDKKSFTLLLLKDGPSADQALAELIAHA
jgi:hypothetical protein